ncbi:DNA terminal protein [Microbacterium phage Curie]
MPLPIALLRAAALKKHANAVAKVSRLRSKGVDVAGTNFDPRKPIANVRKYNTKQLQAYMDRLDTFTARTYRVRALKDRVPLPLGRWEAYERTQRNYNRIVDAAMEKVGGLMPPDSGLTIREREDMRKAVKGTANTENSVLHRTERKPENITDAKALDKLEQQLLKRSDPEYRERQVSAARGSADDMMDQIGQPALKAEVNALSDYQFDILWSRTRFRDTLIAIYLEMQESKGNADYSEELADCFQLVRWAATLQE